MTADGGTGPTGSPWRTGGTDTSERSLAVFRPVVEPVAIDAAADVLRSGWPGPGPVAARFEEVFARRVGAPHAVATSSCTAALHLALLLLDVGPGDEVITSPITFVGATQVIAMTGAMPVFVDVDPESGLLDVRSAEDHLTSRTAAIMVTHLGGMPADLDGLYELSGRTGVTVVEDAAHACGSTHRGAPIGSHPGMQAFSFQATKNLNGVDGGMLCLRSPELATRARRLRWMGISEDTWARDQGRYRWEYEVTERGHRYTMSDLNAAIALAHLPGLDAGNERRRAIGRRYRAGLEGLPGIDLPPQPEESSSATYSSPILVDRRDELCAWLAARGIGSSVHFRRNDGHAAFGPPADLPGAERYWRRTLTLPIHLELDDGDVDRVVDAVREFVRT